MFHAVFKKIFSEQQKNAPYKISGIKSEHWLFLLQNYLKEIKDFAPQILLCSDIDAVENTYQKLKSQNSQFEVYKFTGLEHSPYSGFIASERNLFDRFRVLSALQKRKENFYLVTTYDALLLKIPAPNFFESEQITLNISDIISPDQLASKLVHAGYTSANTVEEPGTFSLKGEIFDIYSINGSAYRIHYFDDMIETINGIFLDTNRTNKDISLESISLCPSPQIVSRAPYSTILRENIPHYGPNQKAKFEERKRIFSLLSEGMLFENYPAFFNLFFKENATLIDYIDHKANFHFLESEKINQTKEELLEDIRVDFEQVNSSSESEIILDEPSTIFNFDLNLKQYNSIEIDHLNISTNLDENIQDEIHLNIENAKNFFDNKINPSLKKYEYIKELFLYLKNEFRHSGNIKITTQTESSKKEIKHLFDILDFSTDLISRIDFFNFNLSSGFYYDQEKLLILSDSDLFAHKVSKTKKQKKVDIDVFAEQLSTLKEGDFVTHCQHGVGKYLGLQSLDIGSSQTDYIIIEYKGNDKIYLPVYKMNLIQKHADAARELNVDSLRTNKFNQAKTKARASAKELAFDLLKLQAERQSSSAFAFSKPDENFRDFELAFPFQETPDQLNAIDSVIEDMTKNIPMDRLVCGDVGFGKTEVAMRAAFKAVLDNKQVAVLVPTTVLALQHFHSFKKRFSKFALSIEFISRFKTAKEVKEILEKLEQGKIDILIGTHKLLSDKIKYQDLGLVIVDEEQRFGVGHKEKLKLLKANVDFLTLTATPIPRTLQLSFLGIRDLSLIQTAPPKRQSIKSYLIKEDDRTIQEAIRKELSRGGQVFIVHNRVNDIEQYVGYIRELVPEAKIVYAHGQLSEKELESRMSAFYKGVYQILVATTIIESGIDIPNANTMIVNKAHMYGLSQLHQLRGRIGRSDRKAYAYFIIPQNRKLSDIATKRLKALQTYADMGSGFNIASCDLEIRGAGDILGSSQSGHIDAIGLELYMQLLKEAIYELRGEKKLLNRDIEFNTPFANYIPNHYITDSSERLKTYKRLSNVSNVETLEKYREDMLDIYGLFPQEVNNLFTILECRTLLQHTGLKTIAAAGSTITLQFEKSLIESNSVLAKQIVDYFIGQPKKYQFTPDYKVIYSSKSPVSIDLLLEFSKEIARQILPS